MATQSIDRLRHEVATCTRLLVFVGILDYSGHVSARVDADRLLILPRDMSRAAVTPESLLVVDLDGNVVEGDGGPPPAEVAIHTAVYRGRPDANAVCHGHPVHSTSFSMTDRALLPMRHFAFKFPDGLPVHPDPKHIYTRKQGDAVVATLGTGGACLLRSHGTVVVGETMQRLFMDCLDIEENARTLLYASQAIQPGGKLVPLSPEEIDDIASSYSKTQHRPNKVWEHYSQLGKAAGVL